MHDLRFGCLQFGAQGLRFEFGAIIWRIGMKGPAFWATGAVARRGLGLLFWQSGNHGKTRSDTSCSTSLYYTRFRV